MLFLLEMPLVLVWSMLPNVDVSANNNSTNYYFVNSAGEQGNNINKGIN